MTTSFFFWETANRWWVIVWSCWRKVEDHFSCFLGKMWDPGSSFRFCVENGPNLQSKEWCKRRILPITSLIPGKARRPYKWGENIQLNLCRILFNRRDAPPKAMRNWCQNLDETMWWFWMKYGCDLTKPFTFDLVVHVWIFQVEIWSQWCG